jgi:hypothetical protein
MKGVNVFAIGLGYIVIAGLSVASGVASADIIRPMVISGNETSVTIKAVSGYNSPEVRFVADEYCNQYGKSAQLAQRHGFGRFTYDCVKSDSVTPAQSDNDEIPAEKTPELETQSDEKCSVQQILKMKDAGLSNNQIEQACE